MSDSEAANERFTKSCIEIEKQLRQWIQLWCMTDPRGVQHLNHRNKVRSESDRLRSKIECELSELSKSPYRNVLRIQQARLNESLVVAQTLSNRINNTGVDNRYTHTAGGYSEGGYTHAASAGLPTLGKR